MKDAIIFLIITFTLQGCANSKAARDATIEQNKKECAEYGFIEGTELYGECIFKLIKTEKERRRVMAKAFAKVGEGFRDIKNNRINCTSTNHGYTTTTNCR